MAASCDDISSHGERIFYTIPSDRYTNVGHSLEVKGEELMRYIDENVIGHDITFYGPFGPRMGKLLFVKSHLLFIMLPCWRYADRCCCCCLLAISHI